jgi:hypothetical protein
LALHALTEEEVLYPAAILVGDLIRAKQHRCHMSHMMLHQSTDSAGPPRPSGNPLHGRRHPSAPTK